MAIGYNSAKVKTPPTSFADLLKPIYKDEVAINGNPTQASAAFSAVFASALANGGSLDNIAPGIAYFKKLHSEGNFVPVAASAATMESGQTPIIVWWDYLLASEIGPSVPGLKIVIPSDASYAAYYGIVTTTTFLGSVTRVGVLLDGDVAVQIDKPSSEAAALAPGASVSVSLPAHPVLVAPRR